MAHATSSKRKSPESENDVIDWFQDLRKNNALPGYDDASWNDLIRAVSENSITGECLLTFTREDLIHLGITRLGPQRIIQNKIEELKGSVEDRIVGKSFLSSQFFTFQ